MASRPSLHEGGDHDDQDQPRSATGIAGADRGFMRRSVAPDPRTADPSQTDPRPVTNPSEPNNISATTAIGRRPVAAARG